MNAAEIFAKHSATVHDIWAVTGCKIGASTATAQTVTARIPRRTSGQQAGEGGFVISASPTAYILKSALRTAPTQGQFFYDNSRWWTIKDVITADHLAEWKLELEPIATHGSAA